MSTLEAAGIMASILGAVLGIMAMVGLLDYATTGEKERYGLRLRFRLNGGRGDNTKEYAGDVDGATVKLAVDGSSQSFTVSRPCPGPGRLFAHEPTFAFDRPIDALFGFERKLETPPGWEGWAFYGSGDGRIAAGVARLPAMPAAKAWTRIVLGRGVLTVTHRSTLALSRAVLERHAAALGEFCRAFGPAL
jgi:hypothetical protein